MIPDNVDDMAAMIYLMEINEWGSDSDKARCTKIAEECYAAAEAFFSAKAARSNLTSKPEFNLTIDKTGRIRSHRPNKSNPKFPPNNLQSEGALIMTQEPVLEEPKGGREPRWGYCEAS